MNIPEVRIILRYWAEIKPAYEKIEYNLDKLDSMIE